MIFKRKPKQLKRASVLLDPKQAREIDYKLKVAKFDRLINELLKEKGISAYEKAKLIYQLKKKIFNNKTKK